MTSNWNTAQTVTVSADQDDDAANDTATLTNAVTSGGDYSGETADDVTVTIIETNTPTLMIEDVSAGEDVGMMVFTVQLSTASSNVVTVTYETSGGTATAGDDYTVANETLTFAANSRSPQTISVVITDDAIDEDEETFTVTLINPQNAELGTANATGTIIDNDERGLKFSQLTLSVQQGSSVEYEVSLTSQPTADVTVTPEVSLTGTGKTTESKEKAGKVVALAEVTVTPTSLTFKPANWNIPQSFTVTATEDIVTSLSHRISGGDYEGHHIPEDKRIVMINPPSSPSPSPPVTPPSPPVTPPTPPVRPPAPAAPTVTRALATSMVVNWQAPEGSVISSYDLRYRQSDTTDFIDGPQNIIGTRAIILRLSPATEYEVQIRASNSTGDGDWSELVTVQTSTLIPDDRFALSLDLDDSEGEQFASFLGVSASGLVSIQIFGRNLKTIPVKDLSVRFESDATQVVYEGFKRGDVLSGTSALFGKDFVNIGMTLPDSDKRVDRGLMGTLRFRATDALSETEIRLVRVKLLRGGQSETIPMFLSVALQGSSLDLQTGEPSVDFDGNGTVDIPDFLLFVDVFGLKAGQERYEKKYDLDKNGEIGIPDFLIFVDNFGKVVSRVPVFTSALPVLRFVEENTPSGQPIGDPVSATSADGESLMYSLWGVDAEYFAIDASTGQLETKEAYNYEARNRYSPIVRVSDGKGGQVSVVVSVAIIDVVE